MAMPDAHFQVESTLKVGPTLIWFRSSLLHQGFVGRAVAEPL
jgi:hypothetical protein